MGKMTEEDRLMRRINQRFMKGVMNYKLIEEGDRILVGLSGGIRWPCWSCWPSVRASTSLSFRWWRRTW